MCCAGIVCELVCVVPRVVGGYDWLFFFGGSVVLNDRLQTGLEAGIQPLGASHLQNKQCECVRVHKCVSKCV